MPEGTDLLTGVEKITDGAGHHFLLVGNGGYATIQAAINAAASGDTIVVAAGTYNENLTINKALTIEGANGGIAGTAPRGAGVRDFLVERQRRYSHDHGLGHHRWAAVRRHPGHRQQRPAGHQPHLHQQRVRAHLGRQRRQQFLSLRARDLHLHEQPSRCHGIYRRAVPAGRRPSRSLALDGHLHRQHLQWPCRHLCPRRRQQRAADPQFQRRQRHGHRQHLQRRRYRRARRQRRRPARHQRQHLRAPAPRARHDRRRLCRRRRILHAGPRARPGHHRQQHLQRRRRRHPHLRHPRRDHRRPADHHRGNAFTTVDHPGWQPAGSYCT